MGATRLLAICALGLGLAGAASAQEMRIQFAEKVQIATAAGRTEFDAYGRRFSLELSSNDRLLAKLPAQRKAALANYRLWRGTLSGQPHSWVRLAEIGGRVEGYIWDGHDLYAVTTHDRIFRHLNNPLTAAPDDTVVFRLSDAINVLPSRFCAIERSADGLAPNNGLVQYRKLVADLGIRANAAMTMTEQIEIALIADSAMAARSADPTAEMLIAFNAVDGIFSEQVGLLVLPSIVRVIPAAGDPFTADNASTLLGQLSTYRRNTADVRALGIAHLITGRDLEGDTAGIARLSGVCSVDDGVSLTEGWHGSFTTGLVMAHELGHNFGAEHDGTPGGTCAATPLNFLMAPNLNFSETFSQCSLDTMRPVISGASCINPAMYAHVELPVEGAPIRIENDNPVVVPYIVRSTGTQTAQGVRLQISVPASFAVAAITPAGVCAAGMAGLDCDLGSIPAAQEQRVEVTFVPSALGGYSVAAAVSATNNQNTRDSSQNQLVDVLPNEDVSIAVSASASTVFVGDTVDVTLTASSVLSRAARNVGVSFTNGGLTVVSATVPGGTCDIYLSQTSCFLGDIAPGTSRQIVLRTTATGVGDTIGAAHIGSSNDSVYANNQASFNLRINSVRDVGLEEITPHSFVQFGMPYEFRANLRSVGVQSINGVYVDVWFAHQTSGLNDIQSVTLGGATCTRIQLNNYRCDAGSLAAGEVRQISVRGTATELMPLAIDLRSYSPEQDNDRNDSLNRTLTVRYGLDASVTIGNFIVGPEAQELQGSFAVWSNGLQPTTNAVLIVELPAGLRFTRFFGLPTTGTCELTDARHLRCVYTIPPQSSYQSVSYNLIGDAAGSYQGTATLTLAGDENVANNVATWPITITPITDIGVEAFTMPAVLVAGTEHLLPLRALTGSRPVQGATAAVQAASGAQLVSLTTTSGTCTREDIHSFTCALGDVPANTSIDFQARIASADPIGPSTVGFSVAAAGDNNPNNNQRSASFATVAPGDLRVAVAATSVTAAANDTFAFPSITIRRTGPLFGGRLEVTLPAGVTLHSISGSLAICSGTTLLQCELFGWPEDLPLQIDLNLQASAALAFTSTVRVRSQNDTNPANDEVTVALTVNAATPPPNPPPNPPPGGSSSGGGGGGGRVEWLLLGLLGAFATRRAVRRRNAA